MVSDSSSFIFYMFVVSPTLSWILQPQRFKRKNAIKLSIAFIALLCIGTMVYHIKEQKSNFYQTLNITKSSSLIEIKRAYRTQSILLHPDKNPSPNANDEFNRLRIAFDIITDTDKRKIYNLFGENHVIDIDGNIITNGDETAIEQMISILTYYIIWALTTYFMTLGNTSNAKTWILLGEIIILLIEINLKFGKYKIPNTIFPTTTEYEIISFLQAMFPPFMHGCRTLGSYLYNDIEKINHYMTIELLKTNQMILTNIRQLNANLNSIGRLNTPNKLQLKEDIPIRRSKLNKQPIIHLNKENNTLIDNIGKELYNPSPRVSTTPTSEHPIPKFVYIIIIYMVYSYFF